MRRQGSIVGGKKLSRDCQALWFQKQSLFEVRGRVEEIEGGEGWVV